MSDLALHHTSRIADTESARGLLPLTVRDLRLMRGGTAVLDGVSLDLMPGGCTMIMGSNGAGKTLLLRVLHGLLDPDSGTVFWGGQSAAAVATRQAMVFQKPVLLRRSVAANLDFVLRSRGKDRSRRDALLDHVGLLHKAKQPARLLSGGEAQRLALARALAVEPEVLFLDEPTASLDPASTRAIEDIVRDALTRDLRVIFVSHDLGQARRMGDDVVFLSKGRVAEHTDAKQFFEAPRSAAGRDYLAGRLSV
ncbi:ATP-binding cassette domain-containing protein [Tropicibacter sp. S64]|uniref:ATP-binding cassette domain-containing protein n=1 Tax=Tropicibacter sp. S64 TaxID=3415122 RepID=UPI003C79C7B9